MFYSLLDWTVISGRPSPIALLNLQVQKVLSRWQQCSGNLPRVLSSSLILLMQPGCIRTISQVPLNSEPQEKPRNFSCWANRGRHHALSTVVWELQRSSQEIDNRPRRKLLFSLHMLPLALLFCLYSAHFFTVPHIILSIFCCHQHLLLFPVFLALNSPFSATIFILIMSWLLSCNSFMLLQNLCQALEMGTFCLVKDAGFHPVPFSCWRAVWQLGTSVTYSDSWLNGTSDVTKSQKDSL